MTIEKWDEDYLRALESLRSYLNDHELARKAANHIRALQEAVEELRRDYIHNLAGHQIIGSIFWPIDEPREDPDDNEIGHEW